MSARGGLLVLWAAPAVLLVAASIAAYSYAAFQAEFMYGQSLGNQSSYQVASVIGALTAPLLTAAFATVLITITAHATLWRRANVTQRVPQEPSP